MAKATFLRLRERHGTATQRTGPSTRASTRPSLEDVSRKWLGLQSNGIANRESLAFGPHGWLFDAQNSFSNCYVGRNLNEFQIIDTLERSERSAPDCCVRCCPVRSFYGVSEADKYMIGNVLVSTMLRETRPFLRPTWSKKGCEDGDQKCPTASYQQ
jgi:hypothetical protein